jgi:hypothetical protein
MNIRSISTTEATHSTSREHLVKAVEWVENLALLKPRYVLLDMALLAFFLLH